MPKMNLISGEPVNPQLSPEEQRFLAEETTNRQVVQDQASAAAMVEAEKAKAAEWAEVREQWREDAEKARQEEKQGAEAKAAALAEDRYRVSVQWARAGWKRTIPRLEAAQRRASSSPTAKARAFVLYYEQALDGWQSTVKLYESRQPFYRMNDRWADILLASENYPSDKENRYYWNKKGMPKIKALRKWTDIMVTRRRPQRAMGIPRGGRQMDLRLKTGSRPNPEWEIHWTLDRTDPPLRLGRHRRAALPRHDVQGETRWASRGWARAPTRLLVPTVSVVS